MVKRRWHWLTEVINQRGYEVVVELGVHKAQNAEYILDNCHGLETYVGVDLWRSTDDYPTDRLLDWQSAMVVAKNHKGVFSILEMNTASAADLFDDHTIDLVFVDADHSYVGVSSDISAWLPKIRGDGILAGHDYGKVGVRKAVDGFFGEKVHTAGIDSCWFVEVV